MTESTDPKEPNPFDVSRLDHRGWCHAIQTGRESDCKCGAVQADKRRGVLDEIADERNRQIYVEGWTPEHDDEHDAGVLARAATCYSLCAGTGLAVIGEHSVYHDFPDEYAAACAPSNIWPFGVEWWKPKNPRRDLVRAAALLVAEIERIDRNAAAQSDEG